MARQQTMWWSLETSDVWDVILVLALDLAFLLFAVGCASGRDSCLPILVLRLHLFSEEEPLSLNSFRYRLMEDVK